jgi:MFS family permease
MWVGGALAPWLGHLLTSQWGWQQSLLAMGVLYILVAFPSTLFLCDTPPTPSVAAAAKSSVSDPIGPLFKSRAFYLLAIGSMCSIGAVGGTILNLKLFLSLDRGYGQAQLANVLSLVLASSLAGRLLFGSLADRFPKKFVMLGTYSLVACALPILLFSTSMISIYVFAVLFGLGLGGDYMIIPLMAADLFGVRVLGRLMGIIITADGVCEALVPWFVGRLRDQTGSYQSGFMLLIALAMTGAIAVCLLPRRPAASQDFRPVP